MLAGGGGNAGVGAVQASKSLPVGAGHARSRIKRKSSPNLHEEEQVFDARFTVRQYDNACSACGKDVRG